MNLILFGFKGVGKTHFGRLLSIRLNRPFFDTDAIILDQTKALSIKDIYEHLGEVAFRQWEEKAIESLSHVDHSIIALGGGAICNKKNLSLLKKKGCFVYLEASLATIRNRKISFAVGGIEVVYQKRVRIYESIKAKRVNVDHRNENSILDDLIFIANKECFHGL